MFSVWRGGLSIFKNSIVFLDHIPLKLYALKDEEGDTLHNRGFDLCIVL
jgi:hypothetical protein